MNKYKEAFDRLLWLDCADEDNFEIKNTNLTIIEELVDKATPMKPINRYPIDFGLGNYGSCIICNYGVSYQQNYCDNCGQKLDWSEQ